ncbi:MAG: hypothetical protein QHJ73_10065 [Armatimonadota bacterium]|nr:hypothetical protein [Armatimonadota bacterium]
MKELAKRRKGSTRADSLTRINVAGIRFLPLAPRGALRRALREFEATDPAAEKATLDYVAESPAAVLCRGDYERVLSAAGRAQSDHRLSPEARRTFARIHQVLDGAVPVPRTTTASSS